jgi:excisionase family DNA binding protein
VAEQTDQPDSLLDVPGAAEYLGFSVWTLYRWIGRGQLPHLRISDRIRFRRADLDAWLDEHRRGPQVEAVAR